MQRVGPLPGAPSETPSLPQGPMPPDVSRGGILNIVGWTGTGLCTIFVVLRIYSRRFITRTLDWSDAIIVFAQVLNIVATALSSVSIYYGIGRHGVYIPQQNIEPALFYGVIIRPLGVFAYCFPKLSVALLIISLMGSIKVGVRFLWFVIVLSFISSGMACIMLFAQCNPPDHLWHLQKPAMCYPDKVLNSITMAAGGKYFWMAVTKRPGKLTDIFAAWSAFTDLVLALYPVYILRNLQVKRSRKYSIMLIMGLGFL